MKHKFRYQFSERERARLRALVKVFIEDQRINMAEFSRRLGITQPTLSNYLNPAKTNKRALPLNTDFILALARAMGKQPYYLVPDLKLGFVDEVPSDD
ncbi:helix-turn-helix domain-containing protein [Photobacterium halotolerans]|uniref:helix-turn-helix domain-containing protein n=1 Tax=Photobacterium halotolerans TaxID=265726 RepID=UPI0004823D3E|nr:helix-turn-helix transcriptional regulator [Photobacterium halotolerans]